MKYAFAQRTRNFQSSAVRDILKVIDQGNIISFAGGLPDDDLFPLEAVEEAYKRVFESGKHSLQYGLTEGFILLREAIAERMAQRKNIRMDTQNILLTTGSQQAIDLFARIMLNPGDIILTENPTYLAALQVFQSYEAQVIPVESDAFGMLPEDLEKKMKTHLPKFVYVVPTFSNPSGKVWSLERREHLLRLAKKYNVIIFEDDPYGEIQFDEAANYTPIAALDNGETVLYTSTFSKTVVPALRTGWVMGPYQIIRMMAQAKQAADLHSSSIDQQALYYLLRDFDLNGHIAVLRAVYKERMHAMLNQLQRLDLPGLEYVVPQGGMFFWVSLHEKINTKSLLPKAIEKGVAYVPGSPFYVEEPKHNTFRLNYTHSVPEKIEFGMSQLVSVLEEAYEAITTDKALTEI
ncbi:MULTISPECIES: PLP-dependent aminotransferase family protein [Aneurinibacillus]|uniref:2-aminoadipate transaminase n=1 Tax=Aneurinibacillus thermoaerophilus TaxID=143495 RepID=A0A1G7ZDA0_ANETH|nr:MULTISPECIES: PLP-dependent aminotransferase family protein [Aneurinibacillus]AMA73063.1 aminotransferase [Aneurinibacillus sp. XH2]MED0676583.1 PLP-dependent aminotransferase family protein [Aneurinibacillus thermoaerophilus]MED0735918.1 PLP-dependent aminotransferase family protein [Aneurinibacillus thermoaerophilus]MED0757126.1 PLP-dependent aminotransferase family protein [Aneurinibacillus thermoaerophilus]MED0759353.1 PLP-dependent aminotransferase family protein [Aneurinibacillus ther